YIEIQHVGDIGTEIQRQSGLEDLPQHRRFAGSLSAPWPVADPTVEFFRDRPRLRFFVLSNEPDFQHGLSRRACCSVVAVPCLAESIARMALLANRDPGVRVSRHCGGG